MRDDTPFLTMLQTHKDALSSKQRFSSLVRDYFLEERWVASILILLYDMGIHVDIEKAEQITKDFAHRFTKRLIDERGTDEQCAWVAVFIFCVTYGGEVLNKPGNLYDADSDDFDPDSDDFDPDSLAEKSKSNTGRTQGPTSSGGVATAAPSPWWASRVPPPGAGMATQPTSRTSAPMTGEEIMDWHTEMIGGAEALRAINNSKIEYKQTVMDADGDAANVHGVGYGMRPNLIFMEINLPDGEKRLTGCDGANAWHFSEDEGLVIEKGREAEESLEDARFDIYWRDNFTGAAAMGAEYVEGEECHKVVLTRRIGGPCVHYISKKTGLLLKDEDATSATIHKDYRRIGGVWEAFKRIISKTDGMTSTMTVTEVRHNVSIPMSVFAPHRPPRQMVQATPQPQRQGCALCLLPILGLILATALGLR